jgi:hypothetical protein
MRSASSLVRESVIWPCSFATRMEAVFTSTPALRKSGWLIEKNRLPWSGSVTSDEADAESVYCGWNENVPPVASGTLSPTWTWSSNRPSLFWSCVSRLLPLRRKSAKNRLSNFASSCVMLVLAMSGATSCTRRSRLFDRVSARTSAIESGRVLSYFVDRKPPAVAPAMASSAGTGGPYSTAERSTGSSARSVSSGTVYGVIWSRNRSPWQPARTAANATAGTRAAHAATRAEGWLACPLIRASVPRSGRAATP